MNKPAHIWIVTDAAVEETFPFRAQTTKTPKKALSPASICAVSYLQDTDADWVKVFFVNYPNGNTVAFYLSDLTESDYEDFDMQITHGRIFSTSIGDARLPEDDLEGENVTPQDLAKQNDLFVGGRIDDVYAEGFSEDAVVTREDLENDTVQMLYAKLKESNG